MWIGYTSFAGFLKGTAASPGDEDSHEGREMGSCRQQHTGFFIQDATKFPDLIHAAKPEPNCDFPQAQTAHDNFWDFIS